MKSALQPKSVVQLARLFDWMPSRESEFLAESFEETASDWQDVVIVYGSGSPYELRIVMDPATFRTLRKPQHHWCSTEASWWTQGKREVTTGFQRQLSVSRYLYPEHEIEILFQELVDQWRQETLLLSSMSKKLLHPCYFRIIGLGRQVLPLLLRELEEHPTYWFSALEAVSGENPVAPNANFGEAVEAWLLWGKRSGYIV